MRFLLLAAFLIFAMPAYACLGVDSEVETFMVSLPEDTRTSDILAKVKIEATEDVGTGRQSQVRVIEAVHGVDVDDELNVVSATHSCAADHDIKVGETYYIAGSIDVDGIFHGEWKGKATRMQKIMEQQKLESNH